MHIIKKDNQRQPWFRRLNRLNAVMGLALFTIVALTATVFWVRANSASDRKDQMSNQTKSAAAAHQLNLKLAPGNSFDAGEQIAVDFPPAFTASSAGTWSAADFSFTDGAARTVLVVNAGPGASTVACADGADNIGVAFDTAALIFRAIPCGASFWSSAAGASITFTIDGEAPNGTLTNPSAAGSYELNITDAAGDCTSPLTDVCTLAVAVVSTQQVQISAIIPGVCGNSIIEWNEQCDPPGAGPPECSGSCQLVAGGHGNYTPPDTTPPAITAVACSNVTKTSMTVTWTTDEPSNSLARFGQTSGYGQSNSDFGFVTSHTLPLAGLSEGTLYHYQACSSDSSNNQNCSADTTCATADETPPVISGVVCTPGDTTLAFSWTTDENSTSFVDYGLAAGPPYASNQGAAAPLVTAHTVTLTGLTKSATYHYRLRSMDAFNNERLTVDATCVTSGAADLNPPVIANPGVTQLTPTSARVTWDTDKQATTDIDWGTADGPPYPSAYGDLPLILNHSAVLNNLIPGTLYHIRLRATAANTLTAAPVKTTFTFGDAVPPVISRLRCDVNLSSTGSTIAWDTNEPANSKIECGTTTAYGSTKTDAGLVTTPHSLSLTGLLSETPYYCRATSADISGNSSSQTCTFTTGAGAPACTVDCANIRFAPYIINPDGTERHVGSIYVRVTRLSPGVYQYNFEDKGLDMNFLDAIVQVNQNDCGAVIFTNIPTASSLHHQVKTEIYYKNAFKKNFLLWADDKAAEDAPRTVNFTDDQDICQGPPVISEIKVTSLTTTSVSVSWRTDKPATSYVDYGPDVAGPPYASSQGNATLTLVHAVTLPGLTPGELYHFRVRSADGDRRSAAGPDGTFTAGDVTPPAISDVRVVFPTSTSVEITWNTGEPADSSVDYGLTPSYGSAKADTALTTGHKLTLTGLTADTTYYFRLSSTDTLGNRATAADLFKTPKAVTPCVVDCADARFDLYIINPDGTERRVGTPYARVTELSPGVSRYSFEDRGNDMDLNDVLIDVDHRDCAAVAFTVFSIDASWHHQVRAEIYYKGAFKKDILLWSDDYTGLGNTLVLDQSRDQQICYEAPTPPAITNIKLKSLSTTSVAVSWTTDKPATSYVDHGLNAGPPYANGPGAAALVTSHTVDLTGLTPGTLYHYSVRSADAAGTSASSPDAVFTAGDVTPPVLAVPPAVQSPSTTAATITWTTDEPVTTVFEYGATTAYGTVITDPTFETGHTVALTGLTPGETIHYQITSTDLLGNVTVTTGSFTMPSAVPPVISDVRVNNITTTSVAVSWTTDIAASSAVDFGTAAGPPYADHPGVPAPVTDHTINLTGLTLGTLYHYRVRSGVTGAEATSLDRTFTAGDYTPPAVTVPPAVTNPLPTGAVITWTTDEPSDSKVEYGTTPGYGLQIYDPAMVTDHIVPLTDLTPETTYFIRVTSVDANGNVVVRTFTLVTPATAAPVSSVTNFRAVGGGQQISLSWTNPTEAAFAGTRIMANTTGYPTSPTDGRAVYDGTAQSFVDAGLTGGLNYYYTAFAHDAAPAYASGVQATAKTTGAADTTPPGNVTDGLAVGGENSITLTWKLPLDADLRGLVVVRRPDHQPTKPTDGQVIWENLIPTAATSAGETGDAYFLSAAAGLPGLVNAREARTVRPGGAAAELAAVTRTLAQAGGAPLTTEIFHDRVIFEGLTEELVDSNVSTGVTYYYGIFTHDDVPNYASGLFLSAKTTGPIDGVPPPDVTGFTAAPGDRLITLTWNKPEAVDYEGVLVRRDSPTCPAGTADGTLVYAGLETSKVDTGLTNGTPYCYRAFVYDGRPNYSSGVRAEAVPEVVTDLIPPGQVTGLAAIPGDSQVRLTWINPSDPDWVATRVVRKAGGDPTGPTDGLIIYEGIGDSALDTFDIVNGTTYHYAAFSFDAAPNYSAPSLASAKPDAGLPEPPPPSCTDTDGGPNYNVPGTVIDGAGSYNDHCADPRTILENYCEGGRDRAEEHVCGDGFKCFAAACVSDSYIPERTVCGDGFCQAHEDSTNCFADCPVMPPLPAVVPENKVIDSSREWPNGIIPESRLRFYAASGKVKLRLAAGNVLNALPAMALTVVVPDEALTARPTSKVTVNYQDAAYQMRPVHSFDTSIQTPPAAGDLPLQVVLDYADGTSEVYNVTLRTNAHSRVFEIDKSGNQIPVEDARVSLFDEHEPGNFGLWEGATFGQLNPHFTGPSGTFGFVVEPGVYRLRAEKDGYVTKETLSLPIINENIVSRDLLLIKIPPVPLIPKIQQILATTEPAFQKAAEVVQAVSDEASYQTAVAVENVKEFIENPYVKQGTETTVVPIATVVAVANVASYGAATATGAPYLMYLYSLITHPFMLIARRRRRKWGVVFDSLSRLPVDLAIVRLLDGATGRVLRTAVTDKDGRYVFIVQPGQYKLSVAKPGYVFPTAFLKSQTEAVTYVDLYHAEVLKVEKESSLTLNIPIDPVGKDRTPNQIVAAGIARRMQTSLGILAIVFMAGAAVISPTPFVLGMLFVNIISFFVFRRLSITAKPKSWGIVYDEKTKKPLRNALARIFEARFNKLLETQITDNKGRYTFLVGRNVYYVTFEKPGYQKQQKGPVDLVDEKRAKEGVIGMDVGLPPLAPGASAGKGGEPPKIPPAGPGSQPTGLVHGGLEGGLITAAPAAAPPAPAAPAAVPSGSSAPAAAPPAPAKKIPWELQILQKGAAARPAAPAAPVKPATSPPPFRPAPPAAVRPAEPKKTPVWGGFVQPKTPLIQDFEHAHPDAKKPDQPVIKVMPPSGQTPAARPVPPPDLIQDVSAAHPETKLIMDIGAAHPEERPKPPPPKPPNEKPGGAEPKQSVP